MSLGGGFVFMRGIFYVTRPAEGEASIHQVRHKVCFGSFSVPRRT